MGTFGTLLLTTAMTMGQSGCPERSCFAQERDGYGYGYTTGTRPFQPGFRERLWRMRYDRLIRLLELQRSNGAGRRVFPQRLRIIIDLPQPHSYSFDYE